MSRPKLSREIVREIFLDKRTYMKIKLDHRVNNTTISCIKSKKVYVYFTEDLPDQPKRTTAGIVTPEIRELILKTKGSLREVAKIVGVSHQTVSKVRREGDAKN